MSGFKLNLSELSKRVVKFYFPDDGEYLSLEYLAKTLEDASQMLNEKYYSSTGGQSKKTTSDTASDLLYNYLKANGIWKEGFAIMDGSNETINGESCFTFSVGKNTPEKFTAEYHFAVAPSGKIYKMNILTGDYEPVKK